MRRPLPWILGAVVWIGVGCAPTETRRDEPETRWWRGNTHSHSLWSDGNAAPEWIVDWYREHGYSFLVLSDHNILATEPMWFPIREGRGRLTPQRVAELREMFGEERVVVRDEPDGTRSMRLRTLAELRSDFEVPGAFLLITGEEITDRVGRSEVHINGLNLVDLVPPQGGDTVREAIERNLAAVLEQSRLYGRPMLAHVNHPNFRWSLTWEDLAAISSDRFFEVYNGHSAVRNHGDEAHLSTERMWDLALTRRLRELGLGVLYGLATDDSHDYFDWGVGKTNPGRGWVMVRAHSLDPEVIVEAMRDGNFYASTGVTLRDVESDVRGLTVAIETEPGLEYTTEFIGTRRGSDEIGAVLARTSENPAHYEFSGDELYVRARVVSSRLHPNPFAEGDRETAWVQPVQPDPDVASDR